MDKKYPMTQDGKRIINALAIEDDAFSIAILRYYGDSLEKFKLNIHHTVSLEESLDFLEHNPDIEIIFLDYRVKSQITGLEILQHIRTKNIKVPIICITGSGDEHVAVTMMKAGASDYIVKGTLNPESLEKSLSDALENYEKFMETYKKEMRDNMLREMAFKASLNGVALLDLNGNIDFINQHFVSMWGYEQDENVLRKPFVEFTADPQKCSHILEMVKQRKTWTGELIGKRKDGTEFIAEALFSLARCEGEEENCRQVMGSFLDITKVKDAEKRRETLYRGIMEVFALKAEEVGNVETAGHIHRIAAYTRLIAEHLRETESFKYYIDDKYIKDLAYASMLHDVGKWRTPNEILLKPTDLSPAEWEIIKQHPRLGIEMLSPLLKQKGSDQYLKLVESVVLYHHERWDGTGYPEGKKGEEIPLSARIVSIADVYDALTSARSYRKGLSHAEAYTIMEKEKDKYDPRIWKVFSEHQADFKKIREQPE